MLSLLTYFCDSSSECLFESLSSPEDRMKIPLHFLFPVFTCYPASVPVDILTNRVPKECDYKTYNFACLLSFHFLS